MIRLIPGLPENKTHRVLCLGAHCDDIEIGCGGMLLQHTRCHPNCEVKWVVFSSNETREKEARISAELFLKDAKKSDVVIEKFKDGFFPSYSEQIKEYFEKIKENFSPDIILTHYREDLHQDHRKISELTWNTFRNHLILEYEIQKYDGDLGRPNVFIPLEVTVCKEKTRIIIDSFSSQHVRSWFDEETFYSLMRLRGLESNSPSRYAEAFYGRKVLL